MHPSRVARRERAAVERGVGMVIVPLYNRCPRRADWPFPKGTAKQFNPVNDRVMKNPVPLLRIIGLVEGVSYLLLLGVAMPLKYLAGMPMAVTVVGGIHGALFVAFCLVLAWTMYAARWPVGRGVLVFVASIVPFGTFLIDRRMKGYAAELGRGTGDLGYSGLAK
jgi:integral membrane protein